MKPFNIINKEEKTVHEVLDSHIDTESNIWYLISKRKTGELDLISDEELTNNYQKNWR